MTNSLMIIRHAERPLIAEGEVGNDLSLTKFGIEETKRFSKALGFEISSIHSSPILRCIQTAQEIAKTHRYPFEQIKTNHLLGDPGFLIDDSDLAWENWLQKGTDKVNAHLLSGTETWPGFHPFDRAISNMLKHINAELSAQKSGLTIWVTHDTVLAALASRLLPQPLNLANWPNFLGYLLVKVDNGELEFTYSQSP